nr:MAG TPA: hypothetical protein [Caudoviricetes sp.]
MTLVLCSVSIKVFRIAYILSAFRAFHISQVLRKFRFLVA